MILSVFVSLCDGCKPSEQRVSLDPRCNFFTQCYKGCSTNSMASSHPFPELTGVPQSHSHFVNVIFNFGNILFMCFTHTTFKTGPLSVCCLLFSSNCPAFCLLSIVQLSLSSFQVWSFIRFISSSPLPGNIMASIWIPGLSI